MLKRPSTLNGEIQHHPARVDDGDEEAEQGSLARQVLRKLKREARPPQ